MPKAAVNFKTNLENGIAAAKEFKKELNENADEAAQILARQWIREAERTMKRNGSVVTGTGIASLNRVDAGKGKAVVTGPSYLMDLDTGTSAHWPDINSFRFRAAARQYGTDKYSLARTIARKGTQPHPWIKETSLRLNKSAKQRLQVQISDAVSEASRKI